ncbi:MAG TPA: outer membrane lipoprotein chaperone LolA [Bacteroidota bacterium]|nr:outer membrane lipoprotein chaperone LolA [Bacteroidota bacterium]
MRLVLSVAACVAMVCAVAFADDDAMSLLKQMEKKYDGIKDATVMFKQDVSYGVTKSEQSFKGKLYMKKGNKYRVELEDQTIVTDGTSVWSWTKSNHQVVIDAYKEDPRSFSPDKVLVNVPERYTATTIGKEKIQGNETTVLKLLPNDPKSNMQWMKVWVDDDRMMKKIQVLDISDNTTTYVVESIKTNAGLSDAEFTFTPPQGVEVIDLR